MRGERIASQSEVIRDIVLEDSPCSGGCPHLQRIGLAMAVPSLKPEGTTTSFTAHVPVWSKPQIWDSS